MKTIFLDTVVHKQKQIVLLKFNYDNQLISRTKNFPSAAWTESFKAWCVNFSPDIAQQIKNHFMGYAQIDETLLQTKIAQLENTIAVIRCNVIDEKSMLKIEKFKSWLQSKRYAQNTVKTYVDALRIFFKFYAAKHAEEITNEDIIAFNNNYILKNNFSASFQNQVVNAIKLFYKTVENKKIEIDLIHRPKRAKVLPNVLSKEEIEKILTLTNNIKHKAMLCLIYSCGLRRSEMLDLKINQVDSNRKILIIRNAKGNKDRIAPLSIKVIELLRVYYKAYKPSNYLFEGQRSGEKYSARSLEEVLKKSIKLAGISKPVTLHWLRHSYATHLLERGTDLRYIQEILGHKSSKTTEIYTHVSTKQIQKICSPIDDLNI